MRRNLLARLALTFVPFVAASAQESLCNPCVDPPLIRRNDFNNGPNGTIIIRAEDMRNLGVTSVAEMVSQLPSNETSSPYNSPVPLGSADAYPAPFAAAFAAAASHLQLLGYEAAEFNARLFTCPEGRCTLLVYRRPLGDASVTTVRECPDGYCATIVYSLPENRIVEVRD
jgi:hypothetical protein